MSNKFYTYIILTERNTLYCGYTDDLEKRFQKHLQGKGAKYTRANKPIKFVYYVGFDSKSEAMKEECRIKKLTRQEKDLLISTFKPTSVINVKNNTSTNKPFSLHTTITRLFKMNLFKCICNNFNTLIGKSVKKYFHRTYK